MRIFKSLRNNLSQLPGWRTRRKLMVIESDDWGSIRMPSKSAYESMLRAGIKFDKEAFSYFDALESDEDLKFLFDVLARHKNSNGENPVITANFIMANPDFEKIKKSNFEEYFYEPMYQTISHYSAHSQVLSLYHQGQQAGIFKPQLHNREHVNIVQWLNELRKPRNIFHQAFEHQTFAVSSPSKVGKRYTLTAALDFEDNNDALQIPNIVEEGAKLFKEYFGYTSKSFIAPAYIWHSNLEPVLKSIGVDILQGLLYQNEPIPDANKYRRIYHYTGQKNQNKQVYLVRNCFFEPSSSPKVDVVGECLKRIEIAFRWGKPAIIGSHRVNFIGYIDPANRSKNLKLFDELLRKIIERWPDVEFISSDELGKLILREN